MLPRGPNTLKTPGKRRQRRAERMTRSSREGSEAELTGELVWQPSSEAVKLSLVCNTKLH